MDLIEEAASKVVEAHEKFSKALKSLKTDKSFLRNVIVELDAKKANLEKEVADWTNKLANLIAQFKEEHGNKIAALDEQQKKLDADRKAFALTQAQFNEALDKFNAEKAQYAKDKDALDSLVESNNALKDELAKKSAALKPFLVS